MYPGFCSYPCLVKPTDQEMVAIEKIVCCLFQFSVGQGWVVVHAVPCRATRGSMRASPEAEGGREV